MVVLSGYPNEVETSSLPIDLWAILVEVVLLIMRLLHAAAKHFDTNRGPLSANNFDGIPNLVTKFWRKTRTAFLELTFTVGIALDNLIYRSVITTAD